MSAAEELVGLDVEVTKALASHKDAIIKGMVEGAISSMKGKLGWRAEALAEEAVGKFMKDEVLPAVQAHLEAHKADVVAALVGGIDAALRASGVKLMETAAKNLTQSWNMKKVVEGIFG